jgi:hypothetical protein
MAENNNKQTIKAIINRIGRKRLGVLIGAILGIGMVGIVAAQAIVPTLVPKVYVGEALKNTQAALVSETQAVKELTGRALLDEMLKERAIQNNFEIRLEDMTGEGAEEIKRMARGIGIATELKRNKENSRLLGRFTVNQNSLRLLGADFYKDQEEMGFSISELFDQYMTVNLDTFVEDYNQSALCAMTGTPLEEKDYDILMNYFDNVSQQRLSNELLIQIGQRTTQAFKESEVKYIGKETIGQGENNKNYKTYQVVLKEDTIKSYLKDIFKIFMEDKAFTEYINMIEAMETYNEEGNLANSVNEAIQEFDAQIDAIDTLETQISVSIDDKKRVVQAVSEMIREIHGQKTTMQVTASLLGEQFMLDDLKMAVAIESDGQRLGADFTSLSNYGSKEDELLHQGVVHFSQDGVPTTNISIDMSYNTKAKEDNLKVEADLDTPDGLVLSLLTEGTMLKDNAKKYFSMDIGNMTLGMTGGMVDHTLTLAGKYEIKAIKEADIEFSHSDEAYLFHMTEEELTALTQKISDNMMQIAGDFAP